MYFPAEDQGGGNPIIPEGAETVLRALVLPKAWA